VSLKNTFKPGMWSTLVIPALGRLRQESHKFEAYPGLYSKTLTQINKQTKMHLKKFMSQKRYQDRN
jgi:hypothetical protein